MPRRKGAIHTTGDEVHGSTDARMARDAGHHHTGSVLLFFGLFKYNYIIGTDYPQISASGDGAVKCKRWHARMWRCC